MNRITKKQTVYILAIILAILQLFFSKSNPLPKNSFIPTPTIIPYEKQKVRVIRVVDGDTIEIEGKMKVRYIGINTPEIYHDTTGKKTREQCFANEAYLENKKLVEGKTVTLIKDVSNKDKYNRLLRYVYVDNPSTSSGQVLFVNDYLIINGYAKIMRIKPDVKYYELFKAEEKQAKENDYGLWGKCP